MSYCITISYILEENSSILFELYNNLEMKIRALQNMKEQPKGKYDYNYQVSDLTPGVYIKNTY